MREEREREMYICVLIVLNMYPHTTMCPHTAIYASSYYYICPHTTVYVSSYCYICVLIVLNMYPRTAMCPHSTIHVSSYFYGHSYSYYYIVVLYYNTIYTNICTVYGVLKSELICEDVYYMYGLILLYIYPHTTICMSA